MMAAEDYAAIAAGLAKIERDKRGLPASPGAVTVDVRVNVRADAAAADPSDWLAYLRKLAEQGLHVGDIGFGI